MEEVELHHVVTLGVCQVRLIREVTEGLLQSAHSIAAHPHQVIKTCLVFLPIEVFR